MKLNTLGDELILHILLALAILFVTVICGLPLVRSAGTRSLTRIALSFALGYVLLSTAGIAGALVGIDPIVPQVCTAIACTFLFARLYVHHRSEAHGLVSLDLDRDDWIALCAGALYLIIVILFFDRLVMWMGGDAVAHAEMVRMLLEGQTLPVGLSRLESYWEYYPKGFHYYAYLWAKAFPILDVIQTVPVVITVVTPLLLYSLVREMKQDAASAYTFVPPSQRTTAISSGVATLLRLRRCSWSRRFWRLWSGDGLSWCCSPVSCSPMRASWCSPSEFSSAGGRLSG